jgi:hypothetical protein
MHVTACENFDVLCDVQFHVQFYVLRVPTESFCLPLDLEL